MGRAWAFIINHVKNAIIEGHFNMTNGIDVERDKND
jgi:hypothetical protein